MGYFSDFNDISLNEESFLAKMGYHVGVNGTPERKRHEILLRACILYGYDKVEDLFEFYINTGQANERKQQAVIDYINDFLWIKFFAKGFLGIYDIPWTSDNKINICLYKGVNKKIFQNFFDELLRNKERRKKSNPDRIVAYISGQLCFYWLLGYRLLGYAVTNDCAFVLVKKADVSPLEELICLISGFVFQNRMHILHSIFENDYSEAICDDDIWKIRKNVETIRRRTDMSVDELLEECAKIVNYFMPMLDCTHKAISLKLKDPCIDSINKIDYYEDNLFSRFMRYDDIPLPEINDFYSKIVSILGLKKHCESWQEILSELRRKYYKKVENTSQNVDEKVKQNLIKKISIRINKVSIDFIKINSGSFVMGSPVEEVGHGTNEKQHKVVLENDYYIGIFPVTISQWEGKVSCSGNIPKTNISWRDAMNFCLKLNNECREMIPSGYEFSLPTEAQWEYACRAKTLTPFNDNSLAKDSETAEHTFWHLGNSSGRLQKVGRFKPNAWGLYDMHGNVQEWCRDYYEETYARDPEFLRYNTGVIRVLRGGAADRVIDACRSARREFKPERCIDNFIGFRLAITKITPKK